MVIVNSSNSVLPTVLNVVGLSFELVGVGIAVLGVRQTWREFRPLGERLLAPWTALLDRATDLLNRLFRHRPAPAVVALSGVASVSLVATAGHIGIKRGPLPSISEDPNGFAAAVETRLEDLLNRANGNEIALIDARRDADKAHAVTRAMITDHRAEVAQTVQRVTVGGIRLQLVGWTFVVASVVLQLLAQLVH